LIPETNNIYTLGLSTLRFAEVFMGPGTLNIAGPTGAIQDATLGANIEGVAFTKFGFATPYINVGPDPNIFEPNLYGGWHIGPTGIAGTNEYDLQAQQLKTETGSTGFTGPIYSMVRPLPRFGRTLLVDDLNGNDTVATPNGLPYETVNAAVTASAANDSIWIMPGTYNLTAPITIKDNTAIRGQNTQTCKLQMVNPAEDTTMITMGENSRLEDISISLTNTEHSTLTALHWPGSTCVTAKLRTAVVTVDNSTAPTGGESQVTAVLANGEVNYDPSLFSFNFIRSCTINAKSNGQGKKRGLWVSTKTTCSTRDTNIYVAAPSDPASTGTYIGVYTEQVSSIIQLRTTAVGGPTTTGSFTATDICQHNGVIQLGPGVDLITRTAGNSSFTTSVYPTTYEYGAIGSLSNNYAQFTDGVGWLGPGSVICQDFAAAQGGRPAIQGYPNSNYLFIRIQQPVLLYGMYANLNTSVGTGHSTNIQVYVNSNPTPNDFYVTFTDADTYPSIKYATTNSLSLETGDQLALRIQGDSNNAQDLFVQLDLF
jgi:hypothetical protein